MMKKINKGNHLALSGLKKIPVFKSEYFHTLQVSSLTRNYMTLGGALDMEAAWVS
jgi:hypothetical protein